MISPCFLIIFAMCFMSNAFNLAQKLNLKLYMKHTGMFFVDLINSLHKKMKADQVKLNVPSAQENKEADEGKKCAQVVRGYRIPWYIQFIKCN